MDGVTIFNIYSEWRGAELVILFFITLIFCGGVTAGAVMAFLECWVKNMIGGVLLMILSFVVLIGAFAIIPKTECIQATIDDTVSWVELTEKYEIIKSDGRIITMVKKEQKDETH